ncbi:hypothetical protein, partial [Klebsiella pneumoniae]|uniref:hypothetical protein n=1 Tax=Klebsiella pneumoniae TaxID=573 RepID=UPI001F4A34A7
MEKHTLVIENREHARFVGKNFPELFKSEQVDAIHTAQVSLDRNGMGEITFFDAEGQPIAVIDLAQASEEERAELMLSLIQISAPTQPRR